MFDHLQVYRARERLLVGSADLVLSALTAPVRILRSTAPPAAPKTMLVLRLERIGDLLMTLGALDTLRQRAPDARIHLVVGSWNAALVPLLNGVDSWETLDVPWLAREHAGDSTSALARRAWNWRARRFDLALNLEPDIRSNLLLALSGATRRVGFRSAGGGPLLTDALDYDPRLHTATNLTRLVDLALPPAEGSEPSSSSDSRLRIPDSARHAAEGVLADAGGRRPLIGIHASGGRPVKQWPAERFARVATRLARERKAIIVLTGTLEERAQVDRVAARLPADVPFINIAGAVDLAAFGAILERLDLFVTGDTGPMHLAAAVGTPVVAIFGPSDPARYGPLTSRARVVTAPLWCRPCNRVRVPPARCAATVPDCLNAVEADAAVRAAVSLLDDGQGSPGRGSRVNPATPDPGQGNDPGVRGSYNV